MLGNIQMLAGQVFEQFDLIGTVKLGLGLTDVQLSHSTQIVLKFFACVSWFFILSCLDLKGRM